MTLFRPTRFLCALFVLHGIALAQLREAGDGSTGPVKAAHVTAELIAAAPKMTQGYTDEIGLVLHLEPGWHVYWINAGDSGEPPNVEWVLPKSVSIGNMQFPAPKRLPLGPLMDYGYEGTAVFPFELNAGSDLRPAQPAKTPEWEENAHIAAHVRWLVCREVCVPGKAFLGLNLPASPSESQPGSTALITAAVAAEPLPLPGRDSVHIFGTRDQLTLNLETGEREISAEFYPLDEDALRNAAEQIVEPAAKGVQLRVERGDISDTLPTRLKGVVELSGGRAYLIDAPVQIAAAGMNRGPSAPQTGFALAVLLAFAGGLVLNLMPCVFPVLFLKALALAGSSGQGRRSQRLHGLSYTAGILVSFWAIVAALVILRAGGRQAGWGFQLQSPAFVVLMTLLFFFMSLSLAGQFDLGISLTSTGNALARRRGYLGSFFTGMLATVVATPCTAPLMGAAIGFALAQSALVTFGVFTALALGLALPYLLLTFQPAWVKLMPRPGRWMETMKQLTAVPLLLTVVWLVWVYGRLYSSSTNLGDGADHIARLLTGLVLLAVAGWTLARWPAQRVSAVASVSLVIASVMVSLSAPRAERLQWQPFSQAALEQAQAAGRPVFVDFTAAWCLSCQVNERTVLGDAEIERELGARHYVLLRADWTRYDPEITRQLASVSRSGVPTYVVYPAQANGQVQVLPELLTRPILLRALSQPKT